MAVRSHGLPTHLVIGHTLKLHKHTCNNKVFTGIRNIPEQGVKAFFKLA